MYRELSLPTVVNLEITESCNQKCRHCYNYWRQDQQKGKKLTKERFDHLIDLFVDAGIFHVVLSGGEPFLNLDLLEYGFKRLGENNISFSCNSNLMLATDEKIKRLSDVGVDHILTSLNSYDPETNDYMVNCPGSFSKIIRGIETAIRGGIRISANMIIATSNLKHVYKTGVLAADLGCQKLFATRMVPPVYAGKPELTEFHLGKNEALQAVEDMVRVKEDTGIMIGTLVSYPLCLLSDLERYRDFVGRGCPGQSGHSININVSGETHSCVHQEESYGNVFEEGIKQVYAKMKDWHAGQLKHPDCDGCRYYAICKSGCRSSAKAYTGDYSGRDPLMVNKENFSKHYSVIQDQKLVEKVSSGIKLQVPSRVRFRKEEGGFYLLNARWANTVSCEKEISEKVLQFRKTGEEFTIRDFTPNDAVVLAELLSKDILESKDVTVEDLRSVSGLGADISTVLAQANND